MKQLLTNRLFLLHFLADLVSNFGDVLYYLALMHYVLTLPDTKFALAMVAISETVPIIIGIFVGVWADRTPHKLNGIVMTLLFRIALYVLVGFLMGFAPSLWIVLVVCSFNFFSDIAGQYENSLYLPISLRIVSDEEREASLAFRQGMGSVCQILFQSSGAILVGYLTYQHLAFLNAGTFLVSLLLLFLIRPSLTQLLKENPIPQAVDEKASSGLLARTLSSLQGAYEAVKSIPVLRVSIVTIVGINALSTALPTLFVLSIKENPHFVFLNAASSLATLTILYSIGTIIGSMMATTLFKEVDLIKLMGYASFSPVFLFLGFLLQGIWLVFLVIFLSASLLGVLNPKLFALIMNELPEETLATVNAGLNSLFQVGMIVGQFLIAALVVFLSAEMLSLLCFLLSLLLVSYTMTNLYGKKGRRL